MVKRKKDAPSDRAIIRKQESERKGRNLGKALQRDQNPSCLHAVPSFGRKKEGNVSEQAGGSQYPGKGSELQKKGLNSRVGKGCLYF